MRIVKEHEERRSEILDTSEKLFMTKGYDKTTINDILKEIGIAKGTLYHYFKSKEEVMGAIIDRVIDRDVNAAKEIANNKTLLPIEKLITILLTQSPKENEIKEDMLSQIQNPNNALMQQKSLAQAVLRIGPILAEVIEEGNVQGVFNTRYPLESIQFLMVGIQTLLDNSIFSWKAEERVQKIEAMLQIIEKVLGAKKGSFDDIRKLLVL